MRFTTRVEQLSVKPFPYYYFCVVDTGKFYRDIKTDIMFIQNYDQHVYDEMNKYCGYKFGRSCRTKYNEFYFRNKIELETFKTEWRNRKLD